MNFFINLRNYSHYSVGYSVIQIRFLIKYCKKKNLPSISLTDRNNLFGSLEFSIISTHHGIQPIIGVVLTIKYQNYYKIDHNNLGDIILLTKNHIGYFNLIELITEYYINNKKYLQYVKISSLLIKAKGLIIICGQYGSPLEKLFYNNKISLAKDLLKILKYTFKQNFFLEISRNVDNIFNKIYENFVLNISINMSIPMVATNQTQYLEENQFKILDFLLCIINYKYVIEKKRIKASKYNFLYTIKNIRNLFFDNPESIYNTLLISKKCSFYLKNKFPQLPKFRNICHKPLIELKILVHFLLRKKLLKYKIIDYYLYFDILKHEFSIIYKTNFANYFLIVTDFMFWSREHNIALGTGRGSGVGSIISWTLGVSEVDPIKFNLIFERFINPERMNIPDFDIDLCQSRREEVINYVSYKYGINKVANIITLGKLQIKAVIKDLCRIMQIPYGQINKILNIKSNNILNIYNLKKQHINNLNIKKIINVSKKLEGINRQIATHAAGIVISFRNLTKIVPLYQNLDAEMPSIHYTLKYTEKIGLIKFDFLGLKTLTIIQAVCKLVTKKNINFTNEILLCDYITYNSISQGNSVGIFQFESSGIRKMLNLLKPDIIHDLIALASLYRPGPMVNIPIYSNRKHNRISINYIYNNLKYILDETYGIIVYQEQIIQLVQAVSGYTLGKSDLFRRAVSKKFKKDIENQKKDFLMGCLNNNVTFKSSQSIFDLLNKFSKYGFNKSHGVAYSYISYKSAYLKANYSIEFFIISLNIEIDIPERLYEFIHEAKNFNIFITSTNVNICRSEFINKDKGILLGLSSVQGISIKFMSDIVDERDFNGYFKNIYDFLVRITKYELNKRILKILIKSSILSFLYNINILIINVDLLLKYSHLSKINSTNQLNLFSDIIGMEYYKMYFINFKEINKIKELKDEFKLIGYYISFNPIKSFNFFLKKLNVNNISNIKCLKDKKQKIINIVGIIIKKRIYFSFKEKFIFLQISDMNANINLSVSQKQFFFNNIFNLKEGDIIFCNINVVNKNNNLKIITKNINYILEIIYEKLKIFIIIYDIENIFILKKILLKNDNNNIKIIIVLFLNNYKILLKENKTLYVNFENIKKLNNYGIKVFVQ